MPTEIRMPQLGESITEGTVGRWLKQPGEKVEKYEPIIEVVTDKVDTEVPSPVSGTLLEIFVAEGETVRVGTVLATLGDALEQDSRGTATPAPRRTNGGEQAETQPPQETPTGARPQRLSPVVAKMVAEHNLDIRQIKGTGAGGRVSKQDVLRFLEERNRQPTATEPGPPTPAPEVEARPQIDRAEAESAQRETQRAFVSEPPAPHTEPPPVAPATAEPLPDGAELVPLTPMRRSIAERMLHSVRTAPHVTTVTEVDMSRVVTHREQHRDAFQRQGVRLTFMPYFVQAAVAALQAVPVLNGRFTDAGIIVHHRINIGVAVALDEGLIVPVVPDASEKNLRGLARIVNDLSERARTRRLRPEETHGGTFTITNHGVTGSLFATPIINQPQAGILGVGAIQKRPVVVTHNGLDAIAIKPMCYCSLTFDHRVCDGATGDAFLMAFKRALEEYA